MSEHGLAVPQVSVIIPAYNSEAYVSYAISSVLASRDVELEVIVIDDESTDGTWQVLEEFGSAIRKVRQSKGGPYKARNLGAKLARGEWIAFLDADDDWAQEKLASQLALAEDQVGLIYTDRINFGDLSRVKERQSDSVALWEGDIFEPLLLGNFITLSSVVIRKQCFVDLGGFSVDRYGVQDWDLWLRYAARGGKVRLCREPLTRYRLHENQMSNDIAARARDRELVIRRALSFRGSIPVRRSTIRRAFANSWEIAAWQSAVSQRWHAVGWYLRSAYHWPWNVRIYKGIVKCCLGVSS
jgi:glycosyltransferase involved in cell wall biosynthesis